LGRDAVRVVGRGSEGDGEVVEDCVEQLLLPISTLTKLKSLMAYLSLCTNAPFGHWHLQYREDNHQIPRVLFAVKVGDEAGEETWNRLV
jgi:hypothetical protein